MFVGLSSDITLGFKGTKNLLFSSENSCSDSIPSSRSFFRHSRSSRQLRRTRDAFIGDILADCASDELRPKMRNYINHKYLLKCILHNGVASNGKLCRPGNEAK